MTSSTLSRSRPQCRTAVPLLGLLVMTAIPFINHVPRPSAASNEAAHFTQLVPLIFIFSALHAVLTR